MTSVGLRLTNIQANDELTALLASLDPEILAALAQAAPPTMYPGSQQDFTMSDKNVYYMPMPDITPEIAHSFDEANVMTNHRCTSNGYSSPETLVKHESDEEYVMEKSNRRVNTDDILLQTPPEVIEQRLAPARKRKQTMQESLPKEVVEKRQKNTEAARRSRLRKVLKLEQLENQVEILEQQLAQCQGEKSYLQNTLAQYVARFGPI